MHFICSAPLALRYPGTLVFHLQSPVSVLKKKKAACVRTSSAVFLFLAAVVAKRYAGNCILRFLGSIALTCCGVDVNGNGNGNGNGYGNVDVGEPVDVNMDVDGTHPVQWLDGR